MSSSGDEWRENASGEGLVHNLMKGWSWSWVGSKDLGYQVLHLFANWFLRQKLKLLCLIHLYIGQRGSADQQLDYAFQDPFITLAFYGIFQ